MRIALLTPTYWPEVRRGTERLVHDLAAALGARGHEIVVLTTHPGPSRSADEEGTTVMRQRRPPRLPGLHVYEDHVLNIPQTIRRLRTGGFDVAHSFFPTDSWAAVQARRIGGPPVVASLHGVPTRAYLVARRFRLEMLRETVRRADECTVLSEAAAAPFRRYLFREPVILPGGVDVSAFAPKAARRVSPTLFSASSLGDPRKRADLLFSAWQTARGDFPEARLRLATTSDPFMSKTPIVVPEGAEPLRSGESLSEGFASAWATVNAAPGEAFGLVLLESLASGTPVICDDSGAGPEIVGDDPVGTIFSEGDEAGLSRALASALAGPPSDETVEGCLRRAAAYDWSRVAPRYEAVYVRVAG